jgi:MFS family permease
VDLATEQSDPAQSDGAAAVAGYRHNFVAFVTNDALSWLALAFVSVSSVMPAFVSQLTSSQPLIGLSSTIFYGGWYLPQLIVARIIQDRPRKKPFIIAGLGGRLTFLLFGLVLWAAPGLQPGVTLSLFFLCVGLWALTDALLSLAAADIMARTIPLNLRGRLMGLGQSLGGLGGLGAGAVVGLVLGAATLHFPANYGLLFALSGVLFLPASAALAAVREPSDQDAQAETGGRGAGSWLTLLLHDRPFRQLMACRVLVGMMNLAVPFYVGYAQQVLHLPASTIGMFVIAQTLAGVAAGLGLGMIGDRWGARYVIRIGSMAAAAAPIIALAMSAAGAWLTPAYPIVFVALGVAASSMWLGFFNYLLGSVPDRTRATYVGLGNTIVGLLTLAPVLGGSLLEATSYSALFGITALLASAGFLLSLRLRPLR